MDEYRLDALLALYVERLVVEGVPLPVADLAAGDGELAGALQQRIEAFSRIDEY
jgi:hypothetical protein